MNWSRSDRRSFTLSRATFALTVGPGAGPLKAQLEPGTLALVVEPTFRGTVGVVYILPEDRSLAEVFSMVASPVSPPELGGRP